MHTHPRPLLAAGTASLIILWPVAVSAQPYDWSGTYLGASLGVVNADGSVPLNYPEGTPSGNDIYFDANGAPLISGQVIAAVDPIAFPDAAALELGRYIGTVSLGHDLQFGAFVLGGEVDATLFQGSQDWTTGAVIDTPNSRQHELMVSGGLEQLYSLRSRVGVAVDRLLLFGTAGLAVGQVDLESSAAFEYTDVGYGAGSAAWEGSQSGWQLGYIAGLGAEYALTDDFSVKLEGLYYDLGTASVTAEGTGTYTSNSVTSDVAVAPYEAEMHIGGTIIRGGVNFRFQ